MPMIVHPLAIHHRTPTGYLRVPAPSADPRRAFNPWPFNLPSLEWLGGGEFIAEGGMPPGEFPLQSIFPSFVGTAVVTHATCRAGEGTIRCRFEVTSPVFGDPANQ